MTISPEQFEVLALEQLDTLYRVARRLTRDGTRAEDLVQETYLRAIRGRDSFQFHEGFGIRPWLLRILHNLHVTQGEREARQPKAMPDEHLDAAAISTAAVGRGAFPSINPAAFDAMDERLVRALDALPPEYQTVLLLWAVDELSYKEIAEAVGIPIGTVMSRLFRARQRAAEQLRDYADREGLLRGTRSRE